MARRERVRMRAVSLRFTRILRHFAANRVIHRFPSPFPPSFGCPHSATSGTDGGRGRIVSPSPALIHVLTLTAARSALNDLT